MVTVFDDVRFSHDYAVEVDPELPGNGQWACKTICFTADGEPTEFLIPAEVYRLSFEWLDAAASSRSCSSFDRWQEGTWYTGSQARFPFAGPSLFPGTRVPEF